MFTVVFKLTGEVEKVFSFIAAGAPVEALGTAMLIFLQEGSQEAIEEVEVYHLVKEI